MTDGITIIVSEEFELIGGEKVESASMDAGVGIGVVQQVQLDRSDTAQPPDEHPGIRIDATGTDGPAANGESLVQPTHANQNWGIIVYEGDRVKAVVPYEMQRVIGAGTARRSDTAGALMVLPVVLEDAHTDYEELKSEPVHADGKAEEDSAEETADDSPEKGRLIIENVWDFEKRLPPIKCVRKKWFAEKNGLWDPTESEIFQPIALDVLPNDLKTSTRVRQVMDTFEIEHQVPRQSLRTAAIFADDTQQVVLLNCRKGLLRVTASSVQLLPHDPKGYCFTGQLAAAYDPNAPDDNFRRVLLEAQPDENAQRLLFFWFGYVLYPSLPFRLSLLNFGPSTTGKTTIWEYGIGSAIGDGLKKNLSMSDICRPNGYSIPSLERALLNLGGEMDANQIGQASRFKLLVGGEPLEVRTIYGRPYTMTDYVAKLVFLTNHLPNFRSGTDAELRRLQFLTWGNVPTKPDPSLLDKVANEKDGVFTRAMVPALQQILGGLNPPPDQNAIRAEFSLRNDPMKTFVDTCCIIAEDASIEKNHFRRAFAYFLDRNDLPRKLTEISVCGKLLLDRTCGKVKVARPRKDRVREQRYAGIRLRPEFAREYAESKILT